MAPARHSSVSRLAGELPACNTRLNEDARGSRKLPKRAAAIRARMAISDIAHGVPIHSPLSLQTQQPWRPFFTKDSSKGRGNSSSSGLSRVEGRICSDSSKKSAVSKSKNKNKSSKYSPYVFAPKPWTYPTAPASKIKSTAFDNNMDAHHARSVFEYPDYPSRRRPLVQDTEQEPEVAQRKGQKGFVTFGHPFFGFDY